MKKYWTIRFKTEDGQMYAHVIAKSVVVAAEWVSAEYGVTADAIDYMSADEAPEA